MGVNYNTRIVNRGLAIAVDAANPACVSNKLRKNLLVSPEDFSNAVWLTSNPPTVTANYTLAPDGSLTADRVYFPFGNNTRVFQTTKLEIGKEVTFSVWIKNNLPGTQGVSLWFREENFGPTWLSNSVTATNNWQRFSITFTVPTTGSTGNIMTLVYLSGYTEIWDLSMWGAQLVYGSTPGDYYPVSTSSFPTIVTDLSPNKLNGTLVNNVNYDSRNNGALVFDNVSAHIDLPLLPSQTDQPLSVFAWVYLNALPAVSISAGIWGHYGANASNCHFECYSTYTRVRLGGINNATLPILAAGVWQYVGFTSSGTNHNYYVNGALVANWTGTTGTILGGASPGHFIGKSDLPRPWNGRISHAVVHNAELTATEVLQNFNALKGRYGL